MPADPAQTFDAWWAELRALADADPQWDVVGPDQESYREIWEDGYAPDEAYEMVWEDSCR